MASKAEEHIELEQEDTIENPNELVRVSISQDIIHVLRVNWELGNKQLREHIQWVLLLLILKVDTYKEQPKGMGLLYEYSNCLSFIKTHYKLLLRSELTREEKIQSTQRACIAFYDNLFKIKSRWSSIGLEEYHSLSRRITSSQLYINWMELYRVDPPRSQWLILRKLAINQLDEILRLFKILTKEDEYKQIENIFVEFMTQFNYYCKDYELNKKTYKREMGKYLKKSNLGGFRGEWTSLFRPGTKGRHKRVNWRNFRIYLPEEMPDLYVYHHQVNTCVLNLSIMSLYPELRVFMYDIFKRKPTYYIFHRKSISISRKALLRSNQLCNLMLELTRRLERSYYLSFVKQKKYTPLQDLGGKSNSTTPLIEDFSLGEYIRRRGAIKPLPFHSYYYSLPLDVDIQELFTDWLFSRDVERQALIKSLESFTRKVRKKHNDFFLDAKLDILKKFVSDDEQDLRDLAQQTKERSKDGLFSLYFRRKASILESNRERITSKVESMDGREVLNQLVDQDTPYPNVFSMIPILYMNSNLWSVHKFLYRYPVSVQVSLKRMLGLSETIRVGGKMLGDILVGDISTCIKVTAIFWRNWGIKVNSRPFRIINSDDLSEFYDQSKGLSKVYMDYATLYLLCVKSVSQALIYHRRVLRYHFGDKFDNNWKLNKLLDMNNEESSNSFQYINKKNINLHSLPNDFTVPTLTKGVYFSILSAYLLLTIGAVCIQTLITIIF